MNIETYLDRINYTGPTSPTAETLRALQLAHLQTVPFENLSIHAGEPIVLNDQALFTKIVEKRRGGFCYELNGLFAALLRALGFNVTMLAAGVANASRSTGPVVIAELTEDDFGPVFDHMTLMVTLGDRWLVDVGFGDSFLEPLLLDESADQVQGTQTFQIVQHGTHSILLRRKESHDWAAQYRFNYQPHEYPDYEEMCRFHQTSPDSHFTKARICSRSTDDGRITLSDMRYIVTNSGQEPRTEKVVSSQDEYDRLLRDNFGIVMTK
jgi:N-hydroxyarylamine O-acetyltransferase